MTSIDPHRRLTALLQKGADSLRGARGTQSSPEAPAHIGADLTAQRIGAIAATDPHRTRKAVRIYLEAELAREFGAGLVNDPMFTQLVDSVQAQMQEDPELATAMQHAGELLVGEAPPR